MPLEIPPALSPGVTVQQRNSKFGNWNGTYGYYQRDSTRLDPFVTDNMRSMVYNMNDLRASKNICSTMRIANKSQVVRVDGPKTEKIRPSYLRNSVSHGTFQDFVGKQKDAWKKVSSSNDFREAFLEYAENQDSLAEDESYITMPNVPRVVRSCLGDDTPTFVLEKFCKLSKQAEVEMRVYWADFRRLAMTALATASADCTLKRELPPLVMLMSKPRINDPDLGPTKQPKTTYSDTFANYDNLLEPNNVFHKDQAESPSPHFTMSAGKFRGGSYRAMGDISLYWWCLVSCGVVHWKASSGLLLSYRVMPLASPMTCQYTHIYPLITKYL